MDGAEDRAGVGPVAVVGAGAWGTALAVTLGRAGAAVRLVTRQHGVRDALRKPDPTHPRLAGVTLRPTPEVTADTAAGLAGAGLVVVAVPTRRLADRIDEVRRHLADGAVVVAAAKGLQPDDGRWPDQVLADACGPSHPVVVLGGSTLAAEVAAGAPSLVVCASRDQAAAALCAGALTVGAVRAVVSDDPVACQVGGGMKNVYNVLVGLVRACGWGDNGVSSLVAACLAEMEVLATALGSPEGALAGQVGLADFIGAVASPLSRNHRYGVALGRGEPSGITEAIEGVDAARPAQRLAQRFGIDVPLLDLIVAVLNNPRRAAMTADAAWDVVAPPDVQSRTAVG